MLRRRTSISWACSIYASICTHPWPPDPEGKDLGLDDLMDFREGTPQFLLDNLDEQQVYGPQVCNQPLSIGPSRVQHRLFDLVGAGGGKAAV
jgi:hypothetical protein